MFIADQWQSYELIDAGDGDKLERWGPYVLQRPDPQAIWPHDPWPRPDARYNRSSSGGGSWQQSADMPQSWNIRYDSPAGPLTFRLTLMGFKHTGLFPEQAANWDFCIRSIQKAVVAGQKPRILNLFAYTGAASIACAAAGAAEVVHLDASKGMNARARENVQLSGLADSNIRFINDDAVKFVERELRRGRQYDGILMDPPAYGRGPSGEMWKLEEALYGLVERCTRLLSEKPLFFLLNAYTSGLAPTALADILKLIICPVHGGEASAAELCLPATARPLLLPCGATGRWTP
ncbi:MAG: class I SAM-dependent methyltransferase [Bacillota bacterium]|nr:class I SAM-dependent methyltransferase [Bacillota bacterium]